MRQDEAAPGRVSRGAGRGQVAAVATAVVVALGGGGAGAGFYLREAKASVPVDRLVSLEQWRATRTAIEERDLAERAQLSAAIKESNSTNASLREAVVALTERIGYTREAINGLDARLRALESNQIRPASLRRAP